MIENQKYWFAARTRDKQEFAVRKSLDKFKAEEGLNLDYYLPTRTVVSQLKYRRKRTEVPVIRNLIFIYATKQTACDLSNPDGVSFDSEPFAIGNKVKVIKGDFSGIEGEIATQANKTYVVIRIKGVLVASIKVPKSYLKLIN